MYGVEEVDQKPVRIDSGVDDAICGREWLEQTILSNIRPRLSDLRVCAIPRSPGFSIMVVGVGKSFRGPHQAPDKRYYRRFNFTSVPMEEYEVSELRQRRRAVPSLLTFEVIERQRFLPVFEVANPGDVIAEDVEFVFSPEIPWPSKQGKPPLFERGMRKFPARQRYRFRWFPFNQVLASNSDIPNQFSVAASYVHPEAGVRLTDEWHIDFEAYRESMGEMSDLEIQTAKVVTAISDLDKNLVGLKELLRGVRPIFGSTGLNLSVPTIRNLKRTLIDGSDVEKIRAAHCSPNALSEVLGIEHNLAVELYNLFRESSVREKLRVADKLTPAILARIEASLILEDDEEPATPPA